MKIPPPFIATVHTFRPDDPTPDMPLPTRTRQRVVGDLTEIGNITARQRAEDERLRSGMFTPREIRELMRKGY